MLTGAGIGGEYAAVNATIQELIPARRRGFTDLVVNGSFWLGAAVGAIGALVVLDPAVMPAGIRLALRLHHRRRAGLHRAAAAPLPAGEPALADDARPARGSRTRRRRDRAARGARNRPAIAAGAARALRLRTDVQSWFGAGARALFTNYRRPRDAGHRADGGAGVLLQRGVLHLCADPDAVLRDCVGQCRLVHAAVRGGQFPRTAGAGATVRHARAAA